MKDGETASALHMSGLRVTRFDDGATALVLGDHAFHLAPGQAEFVARSLRVLTAVNEREPSTILDEARDIIYGDREQTHGRPDKNLRAIAAIWTAILSQHLQPGVAVTPELVCLLMAGLKLARAANKPSHREHALDTVGYIALMERCGFLESKGT